jgi:hypothetical protein
VRNKLLSEANNKRRKFPLRYGAALGLEAMGMGNLVRPILDIQNARDTNSNLIVVRRAMLRLAAEKNLTVKAQSTVDALLRDVKVRDQDKQDLWDRPLRAKFVSQDVFIVVPDATLTLRMICRRPRTWTRICTECSRTSSSVCHRRACPVGPVRSLKTAEKRRAPSGMRPRHARWARSMRRSPRVLGPLTFSRRRPSSTQLH